MRSCNWKVKFRLGIRGNILREKKVCIQITNETKWRGPAVLWLGVRGHPNPCFVRGGTSLSALSLNAISFYTWPHGYTFDHGEVNPLI